MLSRKKVKMEPSSHKIIEKRRRDRINNCLAELSQAVPAAFAKQISGKLEKAEILEMTVAYLRAVQSTEMGIRFDKGEWYSVDIWGDFLHHYHCGYSDCIKEVMRYMTDVEGVEFNDSRCMRLVSYLESRYRHDASVRGSVAFMNRSRMTPALRVHSTESADQMSRYRQVLREGTVPPACISNSSVPPPFASSHHPIRPPFSNTRPEVFLLKHRTAVRPIISDTRTEQLLLQQNTPMRPTVSDFRTESPIMKHNTTPRHGRLPLQ